jgi:Flp pilus assembly protein TadG
LKTLSTSSPARGQPPVRRAATVAEFALVVLFVLAPLVTGVIELGRAMMVKSILTDAARKGAAAGANSSKTYSDIAKDVDDVLNTDHQLPATLSNGKATLTVTVAAWNSATGSYGADTVVNSSTYNPQQLDKVSVKVSVSASDVTWTFLNYLGGDYESENVVMMRQ